MPAGWPIRYTTRVLGGLLLLSVATALASAGSVYLAGPDDYREALARLGPGDTLALTAGTYRQGLPVRDLIGTRSDPIHIAGPAHGEPAVFRGRRGHNTVSITDSAWVTIRDIEIDGRGIGGDGVKLEGDARFGHYITLSGLHIRNLASGQQIVGISTKAPARGWVVRDSIIESPGTGMYFGDADGSAPFVAGLIEHNVVTDAVGYALQIKHQDSRAEFADMPDEPSLTIIRHNVLAKGENAATGNRARPNLLLGHFPAEGSGARDRYAVYGNLLYNNPTERLFQGEGNIALYSNLLINPSGAGLAIMPHKGEPGDVLVFHNTLVAAEGTGAWIQRGETTRRIEVVANAVFADPPFSGDGAPGDGNLAEPLEAAAEHLRAPFAAPGELDLTPVADALALATPLPLAWRGTLPDAARDFDGERRTGRHAGAYDSAPGMPRWPPTLVRKPLPVSPAPGSDPPLQADPEANR